MSAHLLQPLSIPLPDPQPKPAMKPDSTSLPVNGTAEPDTPTPTPTPTPKSAKHTPGPISTAATLGPPSAFATPLTTPTSPAHPKRASLVADRAAPPSPGPSPRNSRQLARKPSASALKHASTPTSASDQRTWSSTLEQRTSTSSRPPSNRTSLSSLPPPSPTPNRSSIPAKPSHTASWPAVAIRDFAFPAADPRHSGLGPDIPAQNARLLRGAKRFSQLSADRASDGEEDEGWDDEDDDDEQYVEVNGWGRPRSQEEEEDDDDEDWAGELYEEAELVPGLYRALYAFEPQGAAEMALAEGDEVRVLARGSGEGWAVALRADGGHALVPEAYLELVRAEEDDGEGEES